jgi:putative ABC transport system ATP-binding protein
MSETPLIEFRGIGKRYGTGEAAFVALHHIDLQIQQGEFVAIMGPSGSGKSTAMNIVGAHRGASTSLTACMLRT